MTLKVNKSIPQCSGCVGQESVWHLNANKFYWDLTAGAGAARYKTSTGAAGAISPNMKRTSESFSKTFVPI